MGRRKIEIKAIKDDRNRSVTFLKRKGGLFKKAHELSVLCSVDVAVIIFGSNKKLYEYSSGEIGEILTRYQYYRGANEHQGPADFTGKGRNMDDDDDDDDEDDDELGISDHGSVEPQMMPPQFQNRIARQNGPAYIRNPGISNLHNGLNMSPHPHGLSQHMQGPPIQSPPRASSGQTPYYLNYGPQKQNHQQLVQQIGADEYQIPYMPPTFPQQERPAFQH